MLATVSLYLVKKLLLVLYLGLLFEGFQTNIKHQTLQAWATDDVRLFDFGQKWRALTLNGISLLLYCCFSSRCFSRKATHHTFCALAMKWRKFGRDHATLKGTSLDEQNNFPSVFWLLIWRSSRNVMHHTLCAVAVNDVRRVVVSLQWMTNSVHFLVYLSAEHINLKLNVLHFAGGATDRINSIQFVWK